MFRRRTAQHLLIAVAAFAFFPHGIGFAQTPEAPPAKPAPAPLAPAVPTAASVETQAKPKLSPLAEKPDWKQLEAFSGVIAKDEFEAAVNSVYLDGSGKTPPWVVSGNRVEIETTPGQPPVSVAFRDVASADRHAPRYWRAVHELPPLRAGDLPLKDMHIALDPGHIGGGYAEMEERWLSMTPDTAIREGSLVLEVANVIKPRLEALGARVSLVRNSEAPVTTAKPQDLKDTALAILKEAGVASPVESYNGLTGDARIVTVQWQEEKLFYRVSEIRARAKRVNADLKPDLVICLHLNAEAWGDPAHPAFVDKNHFHLLVNGCYEPDELHVEDVRFGMFRRLFARIHDEERHLAASFAAAMSASTGLPPFTYVTPNARRISDSPYVYARNLLANRLYECPVIYLEPYVMNNEDTYRRLLLGHYVGRTLADGRLVSSPLEDYARGVVNALADYAKKERRLAP